MEKNDECKRKRSENWNEEDKILLKELIRKRVKHIENKNTDTNTNQAKKKSWLEVEGSFNELCTGGHRSMTQLKTQWAATKIAARKEVAEHRKEVYKTGGGSQPPEIPVNSNDISAWLPNEFVVDSNEFDSDFVLQALSVEVLEEETKTVPLENDDFTEMDEIEIYDEANLPEITPKATPKLKKKLTAKRNVTNDSIKKLTEFDIVCREELHELQMQVERKRIRNLNKEYDLLTPQEELQKLQIEAEKKRLRNLDLEYDMMEAKTIFYKNKSFGTYESVYKIRFL